MNFKNESIKRLLVPFVRPNFLVWGFWVQGIDNDRHFLWRILIGPYWHFELFLLGTIGFGTFALVVWKTWNHFSQTCHDYEQAQESKQPSEDESKKYYERVRADAAKAREEFNALPEEERRRIVDAENRRISQMELEIQREQEAFQKAAIDATPKAEKIELSPEEKRARALSDLTGGGL